MSTNEKLNRREFFKKSLGAGAAFLGASMLGGTRFAWADDTAIAFPDLVAVRNGLPELMFEKAIAAMGGMERYVKKGQTVVVKPNIGWARGPETGANTNPALVKRIVEYCYKAGAEKVYVFDNTCNDWRKCYDLSQIEKYAKEAGATVAPGHDERYYQEVEIEGAKVLKKTKVHELILESDVFINVPILKDHGGAGITVAMKNLMGVVWDRGFYHGRGLQECISDFCLYRQPDLNIVDAYLVTMDNGPQRARPEDLSLKKSLLISEDIVAVDAAAAKIFGVEPEKIDHIKLAYEKKIGNIDLSELNIKRISL